ncbi:hypothetical protein A9R10_15805 [Aeromonas piscicola]|nr:hypothetical protein A9R10_15805 [Aeromonas piscicola]
MLKTKGAPVQFKLAGTMASTVIWRLMAVAGNLLLCERVYVRGLEMLLIKYLRSAVVNILMLKSGVC